MKTAFLFSLLFLYKGTALCWRCYRSQNSKPPLRSYFSLKFLLCDVHCASEYTVFLLLTYLLKSWKLKRGQMKCYLPYTTKLKNKSRETACITKETEMVQPLPEMIWQYLTESNMYQQCDPEILLLGTYPREMKTYVHTEQLHRTTHQKR